MKKDQIMKKTHQTDWDFQGKSTRTQARGEWKEHTANHRNNKRLKMAPLYLCSVSHLWCRPKLNSPPKKDMGANAFYTSPPLARYHKGRWTTKPRGTVNHEKNLTFFGFFVKRPLLNFAYLAYRLKKKDCYIHTIIFLFYMYSSNTYNYSRSSSIPNFYSALFKEDF